MPHVSTVEMLVATTHLKQAETNERNDKGKYASTKYSAKAPDLGSNNWCPSCKKGVHTQT